MLDRFAYGMNLERATGYREWRNAFWPPAPEYRVFCLDLSAQAPALGLAFIDELDALRATIEAESPSSRPPSSRPPSNGHGGPRLTSAPVIAGRMRRLAELLPSATDRRALSLRADAVERGYDDDTLSELKTIDEEVAVVAGKLSTWYGKQRGGQPTAFATVRATTEQEAVLTASKRLADFADYLQGLHKHLRLGQAPAFRATQLFFMAGEGNRHPKHIAYFLPEDEGVKRSPFKRTYYFTNTHRALLDAVSLPLARRFLQLGKAPRRSAAELGLIPTLGVLAHEIGHFVHREGVTFAAMNAADRWASVTLQEVAGDVFGTLALAEVFAPAFGITAEDAVAYHLAECLRYTDRGLGVFPDSDGMYLQLSYLTAFGALSFVGDTPRLVGDPAVVLAGFRSLARVLADTLLAGAVDHALAFHRRYGPADSTHLRPLVAALRDDPPKTVEYLQEPGRAPSARKQAPSVEPPPPSAKEAGIHDFYCTPLRTPNSDRPRTRYQIWEQGESCGDSVTPSTYCPEYRAHIIHKIVGLPKPFARIFSIGCGNAFVEAELIAHGLAVQAIDCNEEAVSLALAKGVDASTTSYGSLPPRYLAGVGAVYADGLLGHLYQSDRGLDGFFETLRTLAPPPGSWLVLSNDAPAQAGEGVCRHSAVADFWLFSKEYLRDVVTRSGLLLSECYSFSYERPLSGRRSRTICIARMGTAK